MRDLNHHVLTGTENTDTMVDGQETGRIWFCQKTGTRQTGQILILKLFNRKLVSFFQQETGFYQLSLPVFQVYRLILPVKQQLISVLSSFPA
jgi:hypothetical protein